MLLVTARRVRLRAPGATLLLDAPAGVLRALRLRVATRQLGTRSAGGRQLTAGTAGLLSALSELGLLRILPRGRTALLAGVPEEVGPAGVRTGRGVLRGACAGPCAAGEGAGEAAALTRGIGPALTGQGGTLLAEALLTCSAVARGQRGAG